MSGDAQARSSTNGGNEGSLEINCWERAAQVKRMLALA